jgi:hypothetical protein
MSHYEAVTDALRVARDIEAGAVDPHLGCERIALISRRNGSPALLSVFELLAHEQSGHEHVGITAESTLPGITDACRALLEACWWRPATLEEVQQLLADEFARLHPVHQNLFEAIRVSPRQIPVANTPGEQVYVVAEHEGKLLYYSDIEEGWELEAPNASGGIEARGGNQFELGDLMHQAFGDPDHQPGPRP